MTFFKRRWTSEHFYDPRLTFDESLHEYRYDGAKMTSVTTWLHDRFVPSFNADVHSKRIAKRDGISQADVLAAWKQKADDAIYLGNQVHDFAERLAWQYNDSSRAHYTFEPADQSCPDPRVPRMQKSVWEWFRNRGGEIRHGWCLPELCVVDPLSRLAGMVDLLCPLDGEQGIVDWKTSANVRGVGGDAMLSPLQNWHSCELTHYTLQLNVYRYILKHQYNYDATRLMIVHLGRDGLYNEIEVPVVNDAVVRRMLASKPPWALM